MTQLLRGLGIALLSLAVSWVASAQTIVFTKIADQTMTVPGAKGTFLQFGDPVADGADVVFSSPAGTFRFSGGKFSRVYDVRTKAPNGWLLYPASIFYPVVDHGDVLAIATDSAREGRQPPVVYRARRNGAVSKYLAPAADIKMKLPKDALLPKSKGLLSVGPFSVKNEQFAAIINYHSKEQGYAAAVMGKQGYGAVVADSATVLPGDTEPVQQFLEAIMETDRGVFLARMGREATSPQTVFSSDGKTIKPLIRTGDAFPDGQRKIKTIHTLRADGGNCVFVASEGSLEQPGAYSAILFHDGTKLQVIADTKTKMPGRSDLFYGFVERCVALDGDRVLFSGTRDGDVFHQLGIYLWDKGTLKKVLDSDEPVDGKKIHYARFSNHPMYQDVITLLIGFEDKTMPMYQAKIQP